MNKQNNTIHLADNTELSGEDLKEWGINHLNVLKALEEDKKALQAEIQHLRDENHQAKALLLSHNVPFYFKDFTYESDKQ